MGVVYNSGKKSYTMLHPPRRDLEKVVDEERSLDDARFVPGDYIDVAILDSYAQLPPLGGAVEQTGSRARLEGRARPSGPDRSKGPYGSHGRQGSSDSYRPSRRTGH